MDTSSLPVLGSWIFAISLLILAFSIRPGLSVKEEVSAKLRGNARMLSRLESAF